MTEDIDLWRAAKLLVDRYGDEAPVHAAMRADVNTLYFGDKLGVLCESVADESLDLVYLYPPFNSKARYNLLIRTPTGEAAASQTEAFPGTWVWDEEAEAAYAELLASGSPAAKVLPGLRSLLRKSDLMVYRAMMAMRLGFRERRYPWRN